MKKILLLFFLAPLVVFASGFSFKEWQKSFYENIKLETIKGIKENFKTDISIGKAEGIVVGQVIFKDVTIPGFACLKKVYVNYNPFKFAYHKDAVPAISKILIIDGEFEVQRDKAGQLSALSLLPPKDPASPLPPPFRAKLVFKNCRLNYTDQLGFRPKPQEFSGKISEINGEVSFQKKDKILIGLTGKITNETSPAPLKVYGWFDFETSKYEIELSAEKVNLKKWGNYAIPLDLLAFKEGETDLSLKITPPRLKEWPASLWGRFSFRDVNGQLAQYNLKNASGNLIIDDNKLNLKASKGSFYDQAFAAEADFHFKQSLLLIDIHEIRLYKGKIKGRGEIDFGKKGPLFSLKANLLGIDLSSLSQNAPGIVGYASGNLALSGPENNLKGILSLNLTEAQFFGQSIDRLFSSFQIKEGNACIETFSASSKTASISSSGKISSDLTFSFQTKAEGIKLSGRGLLGEMEARVDLFQGDMSWKLDDEFLTSPLKNLTASGEVLLGRSKIGEQSFDLAGGKLSMGDGLIRVEDVTFEKNQSKLLVSGQTGIGHPSYLEVGGEKINLEDLKILNYLLPEEAKDPSGQADINLAITGELPTEVQFSSFAPLLELNAKGQANLTGANLGGISIASGTLNFEWQEHRLKLSDCKFEMPDSKYLSFDFALNKESQMEGKLTGILDLSQLKNFSGKYGKLAGDLGLNLVLGGPIQSPDLSTSFWLTNFNFNKINFDKIEGSLNFSQDKLTLLRPIVFSRKSSQYELSGTANLEGLRNDQPQESLLALKLKIIKADLSPTIDLFEKFRSEFSRKLRLGPAEEKSKINLSALVLPSVRQFMQKGHIKFHSKNGFLNSWEKIFEEIKKELAAAPEENLGGILSGSASLHGKIKNLSGNFEAEVKNGFFRNYLFENLKAEALLKESKITVKKLELLKEGGKLFAQGEVGLDGNISLDLAAKNLPLDILKAAFDQDFAGTLNLEASLEGAFQNPEFEAGGNAKNVELGGVHFDEISFSLSKKGKNIFVHNLSLIEQGAPSHLKGSLNLVPPGSINLEAKLKDNALGLLNLLTREVRWIKGKALASLKIGGTLENAQINGQINLEDSALYVKAIDSEIKEIKGQAKIENSQAKIASLTGFWQGKTSRNYLNPLGLAGNIDLKQIFALNNKEITLDLVFSPTHIYVDLPNFFSGALRLKQARLVGPFSFDLKQGPLLKGEAEINNAIITLSSKKSREEKIVPLNFDFLLALQKNVYAIMGDVATFDLSNIFMNLEINCDELKLSGHLANPSLIGKVFLKRGTVTIFNREFSLLSVEQQKNYYPYNQEAIKENLAVFSGERGPEGVMPNVNISAKVEVENLEEDSSGETVEKKVIILSRLDGVIGAVEKERGLNITLASFSEDKSKSPSEFIPATYSQQEIKVMLLPDFIKSITGISKAEDSPVDTNVIVADYLSSRLQTLVFRGLEREIEQRLGLESLTLEYNFGKEVRQRLGIEEERTLEGEKPDMRVGFVKALSDNLFVDVKYSQYSQNLPETGRPEIFNYQLTYKINPIWSIIYYREPISLQEFTSGYEKTTLRAGFSFW